MKYQILHETAHSLRVRRLGRGFSMPEAESLKAQLAVSGEVRTSRIYPATGGIRLEYTCPRKEILAFLNTLEPVSLDSPADAKGKDVKTEKPKAEKSEISSNRGCSFGSSREFFLDKNKKGEYTAFSTSSSHNIN